MLTLAFASADRQRVDQHFGAATAFVIYRVTPAGARISGLGEFPASAMDGNENKLQAKVDFLAGCDAVFVQAIGASAIKQLLAKGVQPIRVGAVDRIADLIAEVSCAMQAGGVPWIERALATQAKAGAADRFAAMEAEGWDG
ncbi:MAG: NifB/NifX family molybdenum-iron cluster-binding protein [Azovibrio sp.]|nr:NifB/NifX family molybdenum-iron cluster-binding protein [Azovibrio sp.]